MSTEGGIDPGGLSFSQAMEELESVLRRIEGDEIDIDQLGKELGRAAKLLEVCRGKIRRAEVEVRQIVDQIEEDGAGEESAEVDEPAPGDAVEPAGDPDDDIPF